MEQTALTKMASQQQLTRCSELDALPSRLDDNQLKSLMQIISGPLPEPTPCTDEHFGKCFRILAAVLPKQAKGELDGKLFLQAYQRMLQGYPKDAISFLSEQAMTRCKWFPTISECLTILSDWTRNDEETRFFDKARQIVSREIAARRDDQIEMDRRNKPKMSPEEIEGLPDRIIAMGLRQGFFKTLNDGTIVEAGE